jgi:hypothetical protein
MNSQKKSHRKIEIERFMAIQLTSGTEVEKKIGTNLELWRVKWEKQLLKTQQQFTTRAEQVNAQKKI